MRRPGAAVEPDLGLEWYPPPAVGWPGCLLAGPAARRLGRLRGPLGGRTCRLPARESTLGIQESTLAIRRIGLWIAAAHVAVGLLQAAIVWYGIRVMQRATERRADDARDEARRLAQADERRHTEVMQAFDLQRQALETLIARTAPAGR